MFGVLQGPFKALRREIELLNVKDVVLVSEVCVILHILLSHMRKSGAFEEEINEEDASFAIIGQFTEEDTMRL